MVRSVALMCSRPLEARYPARRRGAPPARHRPAAVQGHPRCVLQSPRALSLTLMLPAAAGGVHHYDEYGLRDLSAEPPEIEKIHLEMIEFVRAWLAEWQPPKRRD